MGALGLVLTGGYRPDPAVLDAVKVANLFAMIVPRTRTRSRPSSTTC